MTDMPEENWYIVKPTSGPCKILSAADYEALSKAETTTPKTTPLEKWGPFKTQNQAIAKRVGLIRAGKCQPIS